MRNRFLVAAILAAALSAAAPAAERDPHARVRGMTVTCPRAGQIWATETMVRTMEELKGLGVNWIAIHPYASIRRDGTVGGLRFDPSWVRNPIEEAHRLGLKLMIKPHLAYWGSGFSWRGEIDFETDEQRNRFFDSYERWIARVAEIAHDADAFVVGTELDRTVGHDARWRQIVRSVRAKTSAPLTYSASWDTYEQVGFWDALDAIAIQSYFPLVDHDGLPSEEELERAWAALIDRLENYGRRLDRKVVLGELGYNRSQFAALRPWDYAQGGEHAEEIQRRCLRAALAALANTEIVAGAFLWKWFPGEHGRFGGNFLQSSPAMREIIAARWEGVRP